MIASHAKLSFEYSKPLRYMPILDDTPDFLVEKEMESIGRDICPEMDA